MTQKWNIKQGTHSYTHPFFGIPCTSLSLKGPDRFLASAVGMMGTGATGMT